MLEFLNRVFGKDPNTGSKSVAKERLRLVLVHDRVNVSPQLLEALKEDLIRVISEYMEIDQSALEVSFNNSDNSVALIANIPVLKMKRIFKN
ncbi:MAG: cell division topological specificity factor MinE [Firmicutes bacterium]|nr:cell division topological specificity factor MinE [Bacillota bacterium]